MHSMGIHSALAIKRNRKRRDEAKRNRERRYSTHSTESGFTSPHNSMGSLEKRRKRGPSIAADGQTVKSIGMLHIGVVFLVLGAFLLVSGFMPSDLSNWEPVFAGGWLNELVLSGTFALGIGVFLIVLNKVISKKEDDDLSEYVARQLTRTKSGQRLVRDVETGGLTTKHDARHKQNGDHLASAAENGALPTVHSPAHGDKCGGGGGPGGDKAANHLELIVEEECSEKGEEESRCMSKECGESLSLSSPSETQELLAQAERYFNLAKK